MTTAKTPTTITQVSDRFETDTLAMAQTAVMGAENTMPSIKRMAHMMRSTSFVALVTKLAVEKDLISAEERIET